MSESENSGLILSNVSDSVRFFCSDGQIFLGLEDLSEGLKRMSEETFCYHVNDEKNDFATWIYDIVGDVKLAKSLRKVSDLKSTQRKVKLRITSLKKNLNKEK